MASVMVMGASGFFGGHIARKFLKEGFEVHLITTSNSSFSNLNDVKVDTHIHSIHELTEADLNGIDYFVHAGIPYQLYTLNWREKWEKERTELIRLLETLKRSKVKKSIFISVAGTVGSKKEGELNEDVSYQAPSDFTSLTMKFESESIIMSYLKQGLPGIILNPCLAFGPHDTKPSSGKYLIVLSKLPFYIFKNHIINIIDVRDIADTVFKSVAMGKEGNRYLVGSLNITVGEFQDKICEIVGKRKPIFSMPDQLTVLFAYFTEYVGKILGQKSPAIPILSLDILRYGNKPDFSFEKIKEDLEFTPSDPFNGVRDAIYWFKENKML